MTNYKYEFRDFCLAAEQITDLKPLELALTQTKFNDQFLKSYIDVIVNKIFNQKGVFTVLTTLLFYKIYHPTQDVRRHKVELFEGEIKGFSGRRFDTANITPVLKELGLPSMAESGWLTRSLEQPYIYDLEYQGKISDKVVKNAFLNILNAVQCEHFSAEIVLKYLIKKAFERSQENIVEIVSIENPDVLIITQVVGMLEKQFAHNYGEAGAAKLPMLAFHAIYQILVKEVKKYEACILKPIGSYTASDRTSNTAGDLEVMFSDNTIMESVEIKLNIPVDLNMILRAKEKILKFRPKRYYVFSTLGVVQEDEESIKRVVQEIRQDVGCQLIINGLIPTLKYYFRLIANIGDFIDKYSALIEVDSELKLSHKTYWNTIVSELNYINQNTAI